MTQIRKASTDHRSDRAASKLPKDLPALYRGVIKSIHSGYLFQPMNIKATAKTANVSASVVQDWMKQGLGYVKIGGDAIIFRSDLSVWLYRNKASLPTPQATLDEMRRRCAIAVKKSEKYREIHQLHTAFMKVLEAGQKRMTPSQAAAAAKVCERTVKNWLRQGLDHDITCKNVWIDPRMLCLWLACRKFQARQRARSRKHRS